MTAVSCRGGLVYHALPTMYNLLMATGPRRRVSSRVEIDVLKTVYGLSFITNPIPAFHLRLFFLIVGLYNILYIVGLYNILYVATFLIERFIISFWSNRPRSSMLGVFSFLYDQVYVPHSHEFSVFIIVIIIITLSSLIKI